MPECLELPRPVQLLRTTGWNLFESFGLPLGGYALAAWLWGRHCGRAGHARRHLDHGRDPQARDRVGSQPADDRAGRAHRPGRARGGDREPVDLPGALPAGQPGLVHPVRALCAGAQPAGRAAGRRGDRAALPGAAISPACIRSSSASRGCGPASSCCLPSAWGHCLRPFRSHLRAGLGHYTVVLIAAGVGVSVLWLRSVLRRLGIGFRFGPLPGVAPSGANHGPSLSPVASGSHEPRRSPW